MLPVAAGRASASCSGGHPQAAAVSAADTNRPDTDPFRTPTVRTPTAVPEAAADSTASGAAAIQTPAAVAGCAAGCGRTAADPAAAVPAPWQRAHVGLARLRWSSEPGRRSRRRAAVRTRGHRRGLPDSGRPPRPGTADTRDRGRGTRTLRQRPRWTAGSRAVQHPSRVRPESDRHVQRRPARPPDRQVRSLVLRVHLVGSRRIWPVQVGGLVGPDGSRRDPSDRLDDQRDDQAGAAERHSRPRGSARLPSGPILTMGRGRTAVLFRILAARLVPSCVKLCAQLWPPQV
jgi:hypothetical protein